MSDEATSVPTTTEAPAASAPAKGAAPPAAELDADSLSAIETAPANDNGQTVRIGEYDVPVSALSELPDDVLASIKRKIKAAGEEEEISLLDALKEAPKARGMDRKLWEAAQERKRIEGLLERFAGDPVAGYAAILGVSETEAAKAIGQHTLRRLDYESMPPEERAKVDRQRELERRAALAERYEKAEKERQLEAQSAQAREQLTPQFARALEAAGLPSDADHVGAMAEHLAGLLDAGVIQSVNASSIEAAAKAVAGRAEKLTSHRLSDAGKFVESNPKLAAAIAREYAQKVRKAQQPAAAPKGTKVAAANDNGQAPSTWREFQSMRDKLNGLR